METKCHTDHAQNTISLILRAGCLSMIFENGNLRHISIGNHEVLRMIYTALRDKAWLTIDPKISVEEFDIHYDWFRIKYHCLYESEDIKFSTNCKIEGNTDNSLIFNLEGEALSTFEKNRIGFCILHPVEECAGQSCIVRHTNGKLEASVFPKSISPYQPFRDIKSMKWKIPDCNCTLDFYGDVFEMEDQRNWADASFKTYCTPLEKPFPVRIKNGEKISQRIELKIDGDIRTRKENNDQIIITLYKDKTTAMPKIGIGQSTRPESLTSEEIQIYNKLMFDHYRADLYLFRNDWQAKAALAANESIAIKAPLELCLFFDNGFVKQISEFTVWANKTNPPVARLTVFHKTNPTAPDTLVKIIVPFLRTLFPSVKIGSGTNANFAQLNRNRPDLSLIDYISYSIHPQEHANDNSTLVENLQAQAYTVESAMEFADDKEIWISPVNIQRRFNANIENFEQPFRGSDCPPQVDARIMSMFGACWTAGSLKYLIESGISGATFFETVGERGLIQGDIPSRWPEKFSAVKGLIFPVYFVFKYILQIKSFNVIKSKSSDPLKVNSLILSDGINIKLILINFTSFKQKVRFSQDIYKDFEFKIIRLNAGTFSYAVADITWLENTSSITVKGNGPLYLDPYSVNFIDLFSNP